MEDARFPDFLGVRVERDLMTALRERAEADGSRPISSVVRRVLRDALKPQEAPQHDCPSTEA